MRETLTHARMWLNGHIKLSCEGWWKAYCISWWGYLHDACIYHQLPSMRRKKVRVSRRMTLTYQSVEITKDPLILRFLPRLQKENWQFSEDKNKTMGKRMSQRVRKMRWSRFRKNWDERKIIIILYVTLFLSNLYTMLKKSRS